MDSNSVNLANIGDIAPESVGKNMGGELEEIGSGGVFRAGTRMGNRTAWIVSYTPVSKEPRVLRQAMALMEEGWRVVVFGLDGLDPPPEQWNFVSIENAAPTFGGRKLMLFVRTLRLASYAGVIGVKLGRLEFLKQLCACLVLKATESYYWRREVIRAFAEEKPDYIPDLVLGHDYFTADITLEMGKRFNVPTSIDCHEYALGQYSHDPKWMKWHEPVVRSFQNYMYSRIDGLTVVCEGIAKLLADEHKLKREPKVVRSVPFYMPQKFRPTGETITVLYHGEIFPTRALHVAVRSLCYWREEFRLVLRGYADPAYVEELKKIAEENSVGHRLIIEAPVPFVQIVPAANQADIGYFVHLDTSPQRRFSLPNKFFEYVMAGVALVVSDLPEMACLVNKYGMGELVAECDEQQIAAMINSLTREKIDSMKKKSLVAANELNWTNEQAKMMSFYREIL